MKDKSLYISSFHEDTAKIAEVARQGMDRTVASCPGWYVSTLLGHLGAIYLVIAKSIRSGTEENPVNDLKDLNLEPDIERWFEATYRPESTPAAAVEWFERCAADVEALFRAVDPGATAWSWWPPDRTAGFWMRRMAHETAVHRWDIQSAAGGADAVEPELAADGVDEFLNLMLSRRSRRGTDSTGSGESYQFRCTDVGGYWMVRFEPDSTKVSRERSEAIATIQGPASDLFLFLWRRVPIDRVQVVGEPFSVDRYFELVPPV